MTSNPPLMAMFSSDVRLSGSHADPQQVSHTAPDGDFAALLAGELPAGLEAALNELSAEQRAVLEQAGLADGGKDLPAELQDLLQQLPVEGESVAEDALAVIGRWMQLLQGDTPSVTSGQAAAAPAGEPAGTGTPATVAQLPGTALSAPGAEVLNDELLPQTAPGREAVADGGRLSLVDRALPSSQSAAQAAGQSGVPNNPTQEFSALMQRTAGDMTSNAAALFGKLIEQMEGGGAGRGEDGDALDGLARTAATAPAGAATALTARPVATAAAPPSVPFGHQSWGESMVERVMWMSSQNLRSVEIQLDPAELGPLEIHIQNRGQELQVQFVSQNPSVREALEGQMHRLREMFAGQGLEQADVSVADRSTGEQARQQQEQLAGREAAVQAGRGGQGGSGDSELVGQLAEQVVQPLRGLVDYYV